jgi:hypothetical protein
MTSFRQIEANRRNARKSTGPVTEECKQRSRCEAAVAAGFDTETAIERELVLRLASLLWRLRRATAIDDSGEPYIA